MADTKISALPAASAAAGANELVINEAGTSKKLTVTQLEAFIGFHAIRGADLAVVTATDTTVVFDGTTISSAAYSTSTGIFTAPKAGKYHVSYGLQWAGNATGFRAVNVFLNNAVSAGGPDSWINAPASANPFMQNGVGVVVLALNDTLRIKVRQTSGGNLNLLYLDGYHSGRTCYFSVAYLGS